MENQDDEASISKGSQECFEKGCEPCDENDNIHVKAEGYCLTCKEYICKSCIQSHKRMKFLKDHKIQGLDEIQDATAPQETKEGVISTDEEIKIECKEHKGEHVRYYCKSHKVVGCVDCVTFTHRSCIDVKRVSDAVTDASVATELQEFDRRLRNIVEGVQHLKQTAEKYNLRNEDQINSLLQGIKTFRETMIETIDNLSNKIEMKMKSKISEEQKRFEQLLKRCKSLQDEVDRSSTEFENLKKVSKKETEFIRMNQTNLQLAEWEKEFGDLNASTKLKQYEFCPDLELRRAMKKISELGQLVDRSDAEVCIHCKTMGYKKNIQNLSCGHGGICEICKEGWTLKVCRECAVPCKICGTVNEESNTKVLSCGHRVCLPCTKKEQLPPCTECGFVSFFCKLCLSAMDVSVKSVLECGHSACLSCRKADVFRKCSVCGLITGNQPSGSIEVRYEWQHDAQIEVLRFVFPDGTQEPFHPNPGQAYKGATLTFHLRTCDVSVSHLLKKAFNQKLVCTIECGSIKPNFVQYFGLIVGNSIVHGWSFNRASTSEYIAYKERLMAKLREFGIQ